MKTYLPEPPNMTIAEIEENEPLSYKIVIEVVRNAAINLYNASPITHSFAYASATFKHEHMVKTYYFFCKCAADRGDDDCGTIKSVKRSVASVAVIGKPGVKAGRSVPLVQPGQMFADGVITSHVTA